MSKIDKLLRLGCLFDWYTPMRGIASGKRIVTSRDINASIKKRGDRKPENLIWDEIGQTWIFTEE